MRRFLETLFDTLLFFALIALIIWAIVICTRPEPTQGYAPEPDYNTAETVEILPDTSDDTFDWSIYVPLAETVVISDESDELFPTREEITALALTVVGEASNCNLRTQLAVMWTVLNRVDAGFGDTIMDVCSAPKQFSGYERALDRLDDEGFVERLNLIKPYCYDVIYAWKNNMDQYRNLPSNYLYFRSDAKHTTNYFLTEENWKYIYKVDKAKSHRYTFKMPCIYEEDNHYLEDNWLFKED